MPHKPHQTECTATLHHHLTHTSSHMHPPTSNPGDTSLAHNTERTTVYFSTAQKPVNKATFRAESCAGIIWRWLLCTTMCCYSLDWGDWLLQTGVCIVQVSASTCEFLRPHCCSVIAVTKETLMSSHTVKLSNGSLIPYLKGLHYSCANSTKALRVYNYIAQ